MPSSNLPDLSEFSVVLAGDLPCGDNLEYAPEFLALEEMFRGKPEVQYGNLVVPAVSPEWPALVARLVAMLERSRDLRLAVMLTRALLNVHGVSGFAAGLRMLATMLGNLWPDLHPQLDPEDGNDPVLRVNTLANLADPETILPELRAAPLLVTRQHGRFEMRAIELAQGMSTQPDSPGGRQGDDLEAVLNDADEAELSVVLTALDGAGEAVRGIEREVAARVGFEHGLDLGPLASCLRQYADFIRRVLSRRSDAAGIAAENLSGTAADPGIGASVRTLPGEVANRDEAIRLIECLCRYFDRHEPSSPVPILLRRAQRLVAKNFIEILEDIAPEGLQQLYQVGGIKPDS